MWSPSRRSVVSLVACALLGACGGTEPARKQPLTGGPRPSADVVEGKRLFDELRYREAEECFRRAHEADPDDREARELLARVEWIRCSKPRHQPDGHQVSIELAKAELRRMFDEGEAKLDAGDVPGAINRFERVLESIRWFPYAIDDEDWKARAEEYLAAAGSVYPKPATPRPAGPAVVSSELPTQPDFVEGMRHYEQFDYRQAVECFKRANEGDPRDQVIRRYLLQAQLLVGDRVPDFETLEERLPPAHR